MEIALVISSLAGAATAATISKFPRNKNRMPLLGASSQIRAQIDSLKIEKDILTKTISRLHQDDAGLSEVRRDKLLTRYQHQLGVILAKIEKLEEASRYPDLGPLGDGLMSLMDQKLSALDKRLTEISSKITVSQALEKPEPKEEAKKEKAERQQAERTVAAPARNIEEIIQSFAKPATRFELTTLTAIPPNPSFEIPAPYVVPQVVPQVQPAEQMQPKAEPAEILQPEVAIQPKVEQKAFLSEPIDIERKVREEPPKLEFKEEPKAEPERRRPRANIPEPEDTDDDEDDLDSIKREIMKTLSKLEQAEVE